MEVFINNYCLTYFLVKYDKENFSVKEFCDKLGLDLSYFERWGTDCTIEIGRNELFDLDINVMIRQSIKDLIGKEDILLELKNKYNLTYFIERVPLIISGSDNPIQKLSLDDDIIEFMYRTKTSDDLDYHIH